MFKGKIHKFATKISYKDLDMYSVVYHPNYLELADTARNQAFEDFGYPIQEQLKDKVGFTVAAISNVLFKRPLFMGEEITVFTEVINASTKSCEVLHRIELKSSEETSTSLEVFRASYTLVFISIADIQDFPLNSDNIKAMRSIPFSDKVRSKLGF